MPAPRACLHCNQPVLPGAKCPCRGTTTQRGYGHQHQQTRANWPLPTRCHWCPTVITDRADLRLDHLTRNPPTYVAACEPCNSTRSNPR